jgi:hypothetical protein
VKCARTNHRVLSRVGEGPFAAHLGAFCCRHPPGPPAVFGTANTSKDEANSPRSKDGRKSRTSWSQTSSTCFEVIVYRGDSSASVL